MTTNTAPQSIFVVEVSYPLVPGDTELFTHVYSTVHMSREAAREALEWHYREGGYPDGASFRVLEYAAVPF